MLPISASAGMHAKLLEICRHFQRKGKTKIFGANTSTADLTGRAEKCMFLSPVCLPAAWHWTDFSLSAADVLCDFPLLCASFQPCFVIGFRLQVLLAGAAFRGSSFWNLDAHVMPEC